MKRYSMEFDFMPAEHLLPDEYRLHGGTWDYTKQCYSPVHVLYGNASDLKTAIRYINRVKKKYPSQNPHNFRIFDQEAETEPCGHAGQVFFQEA